MIKALIFDLDDTLTDRYATTRKFLSNQFDQMISPDFSTVKETFIDQVLLYQEHGYGDKLVAYQKPLSELEMSGISPEALLDNFDKNFGHTSVVHEGVPETLQLLSEKYSLAMITNSRTKWQNAKIDSAGIRKYFRKIFISEEFGVEKPDRKIFDACVRSLNLKAEECLFIGDHPVKDIRGAINSGMKAFWRKNTNYAPPEKMDGSFDSIPELIQMVEDLNTL